MDFVHDPLAEGEDFLFMFSCPSDIFPGESEHDGSSVGYGYCDDSWAFLHGRKVSVVPFFVVQINAITCFRHADSRTEVFGKVVVEEAFY
jgi:hypothetical protein